MPRRTHKYRLPDQTSTRDFFGWVLAAVVIAAVLWIWLSPNEPAEDLPSESTATETKSSSTPAQPVSEQLMETTNHIESVAQNLTNTGPTLRPPVPSTITDVSTSTTTQTAVPKRDKQIAVPGFSPRPVENDFEMQLALARLGFSPGSIDGVMGPQTRAALVVFQQENRLPATGILDQTTTSRLLIKSPPLRTYTVQPTDLARLRPLSATWLGKSQQDRLDYESILELVAELGQASPNHITRLNPSIDWNNVGAGARVTIPQIEIPEPREKAAYVRIHLASRTLQAFDLRTNVIAHFPCSIASRVDKRPVGKLHVEVVIKDPDYTFNPEIFPESAEARQIKRKLVIPPGPNNPVGVAWIGLDKPGYGIHGTPVPESVGRTESHGCFRLANWNAEHLRRLAWVGMPVFVDP